MTEAAVAVGTVPPIDRREASVNAAAEYDRLGELLEDLTAEEWEAHVADCPAWNVRELVCHVVGGMEANASVRENLSQLRRARKRNEVLPDATSAIQVDDRADASSAELVRRYQAAKPGAVKRRRQLPGLLRRVRIDVGADEKWSFAYIVDLIYTRDTWMHRMDICRATGREPVRTADHDGRILEDVVAEWARRHGEAFDLVLEGPDGGHWCQGEGGDELRLDAVEFARVVSGRGEGAGLLGTPVPF